MSLICDEMTGQVLDWVDGSSELGPQNSFRVDAAFPLRFSSCPDFHLTSIIICAMPNTSSPLLAVGILAFNVVQAFKVRCGCRHRSRPRTRTKHSPRVYSFPRPKHTTKLRRPIRNA